MLTKRPGFSVVRAILSLLFALRTNENYGYSWACSDIYLLDTGMNLAILENRVWPSSTERSGRILGRFIFFRPRPRFFYKDFFYGAEFLFFIKALVVQASPGNPGYRRAAAGRTADRLRRWRLRACPFTAAAATTAGDYARTVRSLRCRFARRGCHTVEKPVFTGCGCSQRRQTCV